jgi:hypothetical protein
LSAKITDATDEMTEKPKRPTLRLKFPPKLPDQPAAKPAARPVTAAAAPSPPEWKCKPCGTAFSVPAELADDESVRCPSCNARLGLASDFRMDPPNISRLRARAVAPAARR